MPNSITINSKIRNYNKKIFVSGDKSLSIRWVLFSSIASGVSTAKNLLASEDVMAAIQAVRKLGIKVILKAADENGIVMRERMLPVYIYTSSGEKNQA